MSEMSRRCPINELQIEQYKLDQAPAVKDSKMNKRVSVEICEASYSWICQVFDEICYEQHCVTPDWNSKFDSL